jgi:hypothetical protein
MPYQLAFHVSEVGRYVPTRACPPDVCRLQSITCKFQQLESERAARKKQQVSYTTGT